MRTLRLPACVALLAFSIAGFAETRIPCSQTLTRPLQSRAVLTIDSRPAGIQITGTDGDELRVSCTTASGEIAEQVAFHFSTTATGSKLSVEGPHMDHGDNNLDIKIEVPRRTSLRVRIFAGQVTVEDVKGDKDIEVGAGQITISSIHAGDYRSVNASVGVGEVKAQAFGAYKGGFFRSFSKENSNGDYRLQAHVTTGEIDLLGNAEQQNNQPKPD